MIDYVFNEDELLTEIKKYIDSTYDQHYASGNRIQVTDFIQSHCNSPDFFRGNAMKYLARYGHKDGSNRKDLFKAVHYLVMMIHWHDEQLVSPGISVTETDESCNTYVEMWGGKIGQYQNGEVVEIGYGELDERGCLIPGTFRYNTER